jgi:phage terminase large subunit-like protein
MDYPELRRAVRAQAEAFKATIVLIEDRASGIQLIQEAIAEGVHAIKRYVPEGDKQMRLYAQTATIENGFVYLPRRGAMACGVFARTFDLSELQIRRSGGLYLASARLD